MKISELIKTKKALHPHIYDRIAVTRAMTILLVFVGFGLLFINRSHAATSLAKAEAESGTITGNAVAKTVAGASANSAVIFGGSTAGQVIRPTVVGQQLLNGPTGSRLKMDGVTVWGIKDEVTGDFGANQYTNRQTVVNTIKAWGGNHVRFRLLASNYDSQTYMTKAQYLQQIKDWRDTTEAAGLYFMPIWWDGLDGAYSKANWATQYNKAFPMMTDVVNALKVNGANDPKVIYEPFNEPTDAPSDDQWLTAMKDTVRHFRNDLAYTGVLVLDTRVWSHHYDDARMTQLEQYDATLAGMGSKNQLIFAKHDYANEGYPSPDSGFDSTHWAVNGNNWDFTKHLTWETEFGNYNGDPSTQHLAWSNGAATWMADRLNDGTLAGASAFVMGPWLDANALTTSDNTTPTTWGGYAKNNLLQRVQ
jgi:hypothetical protein